MDLRMDSNGPPTPAVSSTTPPPPPPPAATGSDQALTDPHARNFAGPKLRLIGQITHKRTYGNKLVFLDIRSPDTTATSKESSSATPAATAEAETEATATAEAAAAAAAAAAAPSEAMDIDEQNDASPSTQKDEQRNALHGIDEVVFSFEVYGAEVRRIRKDISVGDKVSFEGTARSCGRILDATSYVILERWSEAADGKCFNFLEGAANRDASRKEGQEKGASAPSICKFWVSNGVCRRTDCGCDHPDGDELKEAREKYWQGQKKRKIMSADPQDPHSLELKKSHAQRACVLADWICEHFGLENLQRGGVLDVAGGRGEVAFELAVKRGIPCVVVDPRCPGVEGQQGLTLQAPAPWKNWRLSRQQRQWLKTSRNISDFKECQAHIEAQPLRQMRTLVPGDTESLEGWAPILEPLTAVIGLHPDQATGGVVRLAGSFEKVFAVVPCCTFADDFPDRKLPSGQDVRTYDDLVSWLRSATPNTEVSFLPFQGKNLVVHSATKPLAHSELEASQGQAAEKSVEG